MKSGNKLYIILTVILIGCTVFFFSTKLWLPDDRIKEDQNYNQLITVGDWDIQIGNADYSSSSQKMSLLFYKKSSAESPEPYTMCAYLGSPDDGKKLRYNLEKQPDNPNYCMLYIYDIPAGYYYVTVEITAAESDDCTSYSDVDSENSGYRFTSSNDSSKPEKSVYDVKIDYRTVGTGSSNPLSK